MPLICGESNKDRYDGPELVEVALIAGEDRREYAEVPYP